MKILHVVHGYPPSTGGIQWLIKNLSEQLVEQYHDDVTVFTTVASNLEHFWRSDVPSLSAGTNEINGVLVHRFPVFNRMNTLRMLIAGVAYRLNLPGNDWLRTIYNGPLIFGMTQAIANSDADIVLASAFPLMHMYYALKGGQRAGTPVVLLGAIHTADPWGYNREIIYRAIRQANAYIALTAFERDYLINRGIKAEKISVIGPGVKVDDFAKGNGEIVRKQYGWQDAPVIATMGKQTARKRFDVLMKAMQEVWAIHPDARLLIAGARTPYSHQLEALVTTLSSQQRSLVTIVNDFPEEDKPDLLAACDLFILPSGQESFGIAFLEAWACGKPVIGARVGAIPSVIEEGRDGLLYKYPDPNDMAKVILKLLCDPSQRTKIGKAGRKKILENYTWEIAIERLRSLYSEEIARYNQGN